MRAVYWKPQQNQSLFQSANDRKEGNRKFVSQLHRKRTQRPQEVNRNQTVRHTHLSIFQWQELYSNSYWYKHDHTVSYQLEYWTVISKHVQRTFSINDDLSMYERQAYIVRNHRKSNLYLLTSKLDYYGEGVRWEREMEIFSKTSLPCLFFNLQLHTCL